MAKFLLVIQTNSTDATREAEFNEWYDNVHLPDILESPGFINATRYEDTEPAEGKAKFIATYEIETDDIDATMKAMKENVDKKREQGRMSELTVVVSRGLYKQISTLSR